MGAWGGEGGERRGNGNLREASYIISAVLTILRLLYPAFVACLVSILCLLFSRTGWGETKKKARWLHVRATTGPRVWPSRMWKLKVTQVVLIARL